MNIQSLIAAKRKQIILLERHVKMLEQMAAEEERFSASVPPSPDDQGTDAPRRRRRGPRGTSFTERIVEYLRAHPGPQRATEVATALGFSASQVHGAIRNGVKFGRFGRGRKRGTIILQEAGKAAPAGRQRKAKRARRARSARRSTKAATSTSPAQASA